VRLVDGSIQARNNLDYRALALSGPPLDAAVGKETQQTRRLGAADAGLLRDPAKLALLRKQL
jgi:hypothetical protein